MKRLFLMAATIVLAGSLGRAETEATPASAKVGPCKEILAACQAAGYYKGGHKKGPGKGEWIDCMDPIMKGQPAPAGVSVNPELISGCEAARAKHQQRKAARAAGAPAAPAATTAPGAAQ